MGWSFVWQLLQAWEASCLKFKRHLTFRGIYSFIFLTQSIPSARRLLSQKSIQGRLARLDKEECQNLIPNNKFPGDLFSLVMLFLSESGDEGSEQTSWITGLFD